VPRYVLFVDALPHTPTHRVAKFELRKDPTLKHRAVDVVPGFFTTASNTVGNVAARS
jgi:crotonobetaine/carnitine-CoA ligase